MGIIQEKLKHLPTNPGVYVMLDSDGKIIYVGKAKNLKNRVRQYFFNGVKTQKVMAMVSCIADFYYYIVPTEIDALSLENNLIKKHKPRYNILLKDDKTYPYIKVNLKEKYPTFRITRKILNDGAKYFGPFMGGVSVREVIETLNLVFKVRPCDKALGEKRVKPCLNYHLKKCHAPCNKLITPEEYMSSVKDAIDFLSGDLSRTKEILREKMLLASEKEEFELALKYKQSLVGLDKIALRRITSLNKFLSADIIEYKTNEIYSAVNLLVVRNGRMLGGKNFSFESGAISSESALSEFITRYYQKTSDFPQEIILSVNLADTNVIEDYFKKEFDKKVSILTAKQGIRKQLLDMASANAEEHLATATTKIKHKADMTTTACKHLQQKLNLKNYPKRMECYDISNISGTDKVGSMVVFYDGEKSPSDYRRFKIKTVEGADDFKSLQEVLRRRFDRLVAQDEKFEKPDLIIIDGGKGQLSSIMQVFEEYGINDIDLISLAEREEEVFFPNEPNPIVLSKRDYSLKVLIRIRDEAHRFAITYHRSLRSKRALSSVLDDIQGIGNIKKRALLDKFGDLSNILSAKKEDLMTVDGIGEKQAKIIIETLRKNLK